MNLPNSAQMAAFGRHVITAAGTATTMLAVFHLLTPDQVSSATAAFDEISDGVTKIIAGFGVLLPIGVALYASLTASPLWQMLSVAKAAQTPPEVKQAIAATVPAATPAK